MSNLTLIIAVLVATIGLLRNPATAHNPQTLIIAQQAIQEAQQALSPTATASPVSPAPVWDACKNVLGVQPTIPAGMYGDGNGNCYPDIEATPAQTTAQTPTVETPAVTAPTPLSYPKIPCPQKDVIAGNYQGAGCLLNPLVNLNTPPKW